MHQDNLTLYELGKAIEKERHQPGRVKKALQAVGTKFKKLRLKAQYGKHQAKLRRTFKKPMIVCLDDRCVLSAVSEVRSMYMPSHSLSLSNLVSVDRTTSSL